MMEKKMSTKKYQVTTKETTTLVSEMLLWLSPETITTKMIPGSLKRWLFSIQSETLLLTWGVMTSQWVVQLLWCRLTHGVEGMLQPQVVLDPLETPSPAPGLNGELLLWLPSPVPWGPGENPVLPLIISTSFCYLILGTKLLHSFFGIKHKRMLSIIQNKKKCRQRNIENSLFLKRKNVIFLSVVLKSILHTQLHSYPN